VPSKLAGSDQHVLKKPETYHLDKCKICGLIQAREREYINDDFRKALYGADYFASYGGKKPYQDYMQKNRPFQRMARILNGLNRAGNNKVLEIGCGYGGFMEEISLLGWDAEGIELSEHAAKAAQDRGLNVRCCDLASQEGASGAYDAVVTLATIEHVLDPKQFIVDAARYVRPGGILMLTSIDMDGILPKLLGRRWPQIAPPWHLYYFKQNHIAFYLENAGLKPRFVGGKMLPLTSFYSTKPYLEGRRIINFGYVLFIAEK